MDENGPWAGPTEIDQRGPGAGQHDSGHGQGQAESVWQGPSVSAQSGVRAHEFPKPTQLTRSHETTVSDFVDLESRLQ